MSVGRQRSVYMQGGNDGGWTYVTMIVIYTRLCPDEPKKKLSKPWIETIYGIKKRNMEKNVPGQKRLPSAH